VAARRGAAVAAAGVAELAVSGSDVFGFLPLDRPITFNDGAVEPVPFLAGQMEQVRQLTHRDGYLCPPWTHDHALSRQPPVGDQTLRPVHLYRLPSSHTIRLDCALVDASVPFRQGDGAFVMYYLGLVFGYRLQFDEWWFDGRLPMFPRRWREPLSESLEAKLISDAYQTWRGWPPLERTRFTNLLYMHVRSATYEWDWERFTVNYMVFDGCYKMAEALKLIQPSPGHAARFDTLFQWLQIPQDAQRVADLAAHRNLLVHETLWNQQQPGTGLAARCKQTTFRGSTTAYCSPSRVIGVRTCQLPGVVGDWPGSDVRGRTSVDTSEVTLGH
jgi:hypothetical protein